MSETTQYKPGDIANGHVLGQDGSWQALPPAPAAAKPKSKKWKVVGGVVVALFVIGSITGGGDDDKATDKADTKPVAAQVDESKAKAEPKAEPKSEPQPEPEPEPAAMKVSAVQMLDQFDANEAAADLKYKGKTLEVTGTAVKVDTEFLDDDQYVIQVNGGGAWDILSVNCNDVSAAEAARVKVDSQVTVLGTFDDGGDLGVELKDCAIV